MLEDIIGEIWVIACLVLVTIAKVIMDRNKKQKSFCNDGQRFVIPYCPDHATIDEKLDKQENAITEIKTDVKWIKKNINSKGES